MRLVIERYPKVTLPIEMSTNEFVYPLLRLGMSVLELMQESILDIQSVWQDKIYNRFKFATHLYAAP